MSTVHDLLHDLCLVGIRLAHDGEQLCVEAPPGTLSPAILALLKAHKPELLRWLALHAAQPETLCPDCGHGVFHQRKVDGCWCCDWCRPPRPGTWLGKLVVSGGLPWPEPGAEAENGGL